MYTKWSQHLIDVEDKNKFEKRVYSARAVLDRLLTILKEEKVIVLNTERTVKDFDQPNWSEKQAFRNGRCAEISALINLIDLDQQVDNKKEIS